MSVPILSEGRATRVETRLGVTVLGRELGVTHGSQVRKTGGRWTVVCEARMCTIEGWLEVIRDTFSVFNAKWVVCSYAEMNYLVNLTKRSGRTPVHQLLAPLTRASLNLFLQLIKKGFLGWCVRYPP